LSIEPSWTPSALAAAGRRGAGLELGERVAERRAARLVAERVHVRDVVRGRVEHDLVRLEAADRGEHPSHHRDIPCLSLVSVVPGLLGEVQPVVVSAARVMR
jgi:hypothetical protein